MGIGECEVLKWTSVPVSSQIRKKPHRVVSVQTFGVAPGGAQERDLGTEAGLLATGRRILGAAR